MKPPRHRLALIVVGFIAVIALVLAAARWANPPERARAGGRTPPAPEAPRHPTLLANCVLFDGTGGDVTRNAVILVADGRIGQVGERAGMAVPPDAEVIDLGGAFVMPAVINAHVHNSQTTDILRTWAEQGVCTVRDVGAPHPAEGIFVLRDKLAGDPRYARIVACGPLVTVPGGYPIAGNGFPSLTIESPDDARVKIGRLLDQGADAIKVALESGRNWPEMGEAEMRAVVETAHQRGRPVTAHVTRSALLQRAVNAGLDDACHSSVDPIPDALIAAMVERGVAMVPTLTALKRNPEAMTNVRRFVAAGGKIAMGNDGGYMPGLEIGMPVGELEAMRDAGMTPAQVLVAATRSAAEVCRVEKDLGTIEPGKQADLIVLGASPLEDLKAMAAIRFVMHNGVIIRGPEAGKQH